MMAGHGRWGVLQRERDPTRVTGTSTGWETAISGTGEAGRRRAGRGRPPPEGRSLAGTRPPGRAERRPERRLAGGVAALVQHVDGGVDGEEPARQGVVQHLGEGIAALALDVVAGDADEVLGVLVAVHQLAEVL